MNKLYTGKGDRGKTTLFACDQKRISKNALVIHALGSVDELGSHIGFVRVLAEKEGASFVNILFAIQNMLFVLQAEIAGAEKKIEQSHVLYIEEKIAEIAEHLPEVQSFVVPGGTEISAYLHVCRTVCRHAERAVIAAKDDMPAYVGSTAIVFLNRLSSLFYAFARNANYQAGILEPPPQYT